MNCYNFRFSGSHFHMKNLMLIGEGRLVLHHTTGKSMFASVKIGALGCLGFPMLHIIRISYAINTCHMSLLLMNAYVAGQF